MKREPLPATLETEISPPISRARRLAIARPSPVPPLPAGERGIHLHELVEDAPELGLGDPDPGVRHVYGDGRRPRSGGRPE